MYGWRLISLTAVLLVLTLLLCYIADPYSLYGRFYVVDNVEVNSPGFSNQIRMSKAIAIKYRKPEVLIMGSSRSSYGFTSQAFEQFFAKKQIYNASFNGANAYEILRYFQHAVAAGNIKHAYIGVDFFQFHGGRPVKPTFNEDRLIVDINNHPSGSAINDWVTTLLSGDAALYSIKLLTGLCSWDDLYLANGFKLYDRSGADLHEFIANEKTYIEKTYTRPKFNFKIPDTQKTTFDYFRKIIQLAHEKQIYLHFFFHLPMLDNGKLSHN